MYRVNLPPPKSPIVRDHLISPCISLPSANEVWSKVMFLHLSVSYSVHRRGVSASGDGGDPGHPPRHTHTPGHTPGGDGD